MRHAHGHYHDTAADPAGASDTDLATAGDVVRDPHGGTRVNSPTRRLTIEATYDL